MFLPAAALPKYLAHKALSSKQFTRKNVYMRFQLFSFTFGMAGLNV